MAMQRNYFSILFWIKKTKLLKNGEAPICMRITVNGKRAEIQIKRSVEINKWNAQRECAIGKGRKHLELNHYLETVRTRVLQIHRELEFFLAIFNGVIIPSQSTRSTRFSYQDRLHAPAGE